MLPEALIGESHRGGHICDDWELRVTERCLREDLGETPRRDGSNEPRYEFQDLARHEIVKALVAERCDKTTSTRQVAPLTCGKPVWVLARGHDHRGATWYDETNRVVWLVAAGKHRSGADDDFFPYCKSVDAEGRLLPDVDDYESLENDRGFRFAAAVRIEAPLALRKAREAKVEERFMFGGKYGACMAIEIADDLEQTTVAFLVQSIPSQEHLALILAALHGDGDWWPTNRMPSRELNPSEEVAFVHLHERRA